MDRIKHAFRADLYNKPSVTGKPHDSGDQYGVSYEIEQEQVNSSACPGPITVAYNSRLCNFRERSFDAPNCCCLDDFKVRRMELMFEANL